MKKWIAIVLALCGLGVVFIGYIGIHLNSKNWTYIFWGLIVIWGAFGFYRLGQKK